jgi:outer membrane protein assembly factor BamB
MKMRFALLTAGLFFAIGNDVSADDWPQWRGPKRDGISKETGLLKQWPEAGPKLAWENKDVGQGYGSPAVANGVVYLISNSGVENESVTAYSAKDGAKKWSTRIGAVGNPNQQPKYPGSRSTPTVDGKDVFALGSDGDIVALDTATGSVKWQKSARKEFGGEPGVWAYSESPLVNGDAIVFAPGGSNVTMVALKKSSGEVIWKNSTPDVGQAAYSSAIVVNHGGVKQYVQLMQKAMIGVDAKTGKLLWRYERAAKGSPANIPTPVEKDGIIYTAGARTGAGAVKLNVSGNDVTAEEVYFDTKLPAAIGGSVLVGDTLYGTSATGLAAIDFATGKVKWQEKSIAPASLLFADGHLYLHSEEGALALVEASPEAYKEKGRFTPAAIPERPNKGKAWAYPALSEGSLYIRDGTSLWRYDVKQ